MVVERGGGGGRGWALVDVIAWRRDVASWCCGGVVSHDRRDLTLRSGDVGSEMVVVVERDVAEQW